MQVEQPGWAKVAFGDEGEWTFSWKCPAKLLQFTLRAWEREREGKESYLQSDDTSKARPSKTEKAENKPLESSPSGGWRENGPVKESEEGPSEMRTDRETQCEARSAQTRTTSSNTAVVPGG
jgi:hypothetical protein